MAKRSTSKTQKKEGAALFPYPKERPKVIYFDL